MTNSLLGSCLNHDLCVFWVSSPTYPNSLGTKAHVIVVVVVVVVVIIVVVVVVVVV